MPLTWLHNQFVAVVLTAIVASGLAFADDEQVGAPQHSQASADNQVPADSSTATAAKAEQTPVTTVSGADRVQRSADKPPAEIVQGIERAQFSLPTLEKLEQSFRDRDRVNGETFSQVLEDLRRKDPAMTSAQVRQLKNLYDQKLASVPPEKVGPQISAAARTVLDKRKGSSSDGASLRGGESFNPETKATPNPAAKLGTLDPNFFKEEKADGKPSDKDGEGAERGKQEKEDQPAPDNRRGDLLDALKLVLGAEEEKKDKDDDGRGLQTPPNEAPVPAAQPPQSSDDSDDREKGDQEGLGNLPQKPDPMIGQLLAGLGSKGNTDSKKDDKDSTETPKEKSSSSSKKEPKEDDSDKLSKLLDDEKPPEELPTTPPPDDLLNAAKGMGAQFPQNKTALPVLPPPSGGGGGAPSGLDPAAMAANANLGGPAFGGGGGAPVGGGGGAAFQGDPFGSIGSESGGGAAGNFNYTRLAEFGSSSGGSESGSQSEGSGSGYDSSGGTKRSYAMMDEIRTFPVDTSGISIVERYHGKLGETVCDAPEADRVAVCVAIADARAERARQAARNSPSYQ